MKSIRALDESQSKAARIAGCAFLFAIVIVVTANYGINFRLIVPGNAVDTALNIRAHEMLFRLNIACNLIYSFSLVVLLASLYVILKPVSRVLALLAAYCRMVLALMWCVAGLESLGALRLLGNTAYLPVFDSNQLQTLARLHLAAGYDVYYIGLPFWGIASTICYYLWLKSEYIPKGLAVLGLFSSAWCVFCAFTFIVYPHFEATVNASWFDMPMLLSEMALGFWLVFKGLRPSGRAGPKTTSSQAKTDAA
jgi:hypothetical protein